MKKGLSLPINTLVILSIAIIVLIALVVFFIWGFVIPGQEVDCQSLIQSKCTGYTLTGIVPPVDDNLRNCGVTDSWDEDNWNQVCRVGQ